MFLFFFFFFVSIWSQEALNLLIVSPVLLHLLMSGDTIVCKQFQWINRAPSGARWQIWPLENSSQFRKLMMHILVSITVHLSLSFHSLNSLKWCNASVSAQSHTGSEKGRARSPSTTSGTSPTLQPGSGGKGNLLLTLRYLRLNPSWLGVYLGCQGGRRAGEWSALGNVRTAPSAS